MMRRSFSFNEILLHYGVSITLSEFITCFLDVYNFLDYKYSALQVSLLINVTSAFLPSIPISFSLSPVRAIVSTYVGTCGWWKKVYDNVA
jgi:hypothetical protein